MSTKYFSNAAIALLGAFVVVVSVSLSSTVAVGWIAFGIAIGVLGLTALAQLDRRRGQIQRALDAVMAADAATLLAVSVVFGAATVTWLAFALALGVVGVAFTGMTLHEIGTWRAVHDLGRLRWLGREQEALEVYTAQHRVA